MEEGGWRLGLPRRVSDPLSISLRRFVARFRGFVHGHELAVLGLAIPAAGFVVDTGVEIHPDFTGRFGSGDVGSGRVLGGKV